MWNWCLTIGENKYSIEEIKIYFTCWYIDILNKITSIMKIETRIQDGKRLHLNFKHPLVFTIKCSFKFLCFCKYFHKLILIFQIKTPWFPNSISIFANAFANKSNEKKNGLTPLRNINGDTLDDEIPPMPKKILGKPNFYLIAGIYEHNFAKI